MAEVGRIREKAAAAAIMDLENIMNKERKNNSKMIVGRPKPGKSVM
jgi:hypothetical protein